MEINKTRTKGASCGKRKTKMSRAQSLYLLCRHNRLMNGLYCDECLEEKRLDNSISERMGSLSLCSHYQPQRTCEVCLGNFLAFAMCTHERLGNLSASLERIVTEKREVIRGDEVLSTVVTIKSRHNAFRLMSCDILQVIWHFYQFAC